MNDDQINEILSRVKVPEPPAGWEDYDLKVARAIIDHAASVCEAQAERWTDDRARYVAHECAAAVRAGEGVSMRYDGLYEYAQQHRLDYNELCRVVRNANVVATKAADRAEAERNYAEYCEREGITKP